jgi:hypothetical protein
MTGSYSIDRSTASGAIYRWFLCNDAYNKAVSLRDGAYMQSLDLLLMTVMCNVLI